MKFLLLFFGAIMASASAAFHWPRQLERSNRIVGGEIIDITEAPHMAAMSGSIGGGFGGGVIVAPRYILTAAHCVEKDIPSSLDVVIGANWPGLDGESVEVLNITLHPTFDIAVLELKEDIQFDDTKQPLKLADADDDVADGTMMAAAGWGETRNPDETDDNLRRVFLEKINKDRCHEQFICVQTLGKNGCMGDSGGPLWVNNTVFGIFHGIHNCEGTRPSYYVRIPFVRDWLNSVMKM